MPPDLADHLHLAPDLRMAAHLYRELSGRPPAVVWQVPGTVTLLADGPLRLTVVAARWGAIAVAGPRPDDMVELIRLDRPAEPSRLTVAGPRSAHAGATVLVTTAPPDGSGPGAAAAAETAIALCLQDMASTVPAQVQPEAPPSSPHARLGDRPLPFDLEAAGLRLAVIDTRVRGVPQPPIVESAPLAAAAAALAAGDIKALAPLLTAAHRAHPGDEVQDLAVSALLSAGALGARTITDGPGRPVCALLPADRLPDVRASVAAAFARHGLRAPRLITITPAAGPRRTSG